MDIKLRDRVKDSETGTLGTVTAICHWATEEEVDDGEGGKKKVPAELIQLAVLPDGASKFEWVSAETCRVTKAAD